MIAWAHHKQNSHCPSIHMPRWASRITVEITDLCVERLQSMSHDDAMAEGIHQLGLEGWRAPNEETGEAGLELREQSLTIAQLAYSHYWDELHAKGDGVLWDANPWVWCITFRRAEATVVRDSEREGERA